MEEIIVDGFAGDSVTIGVKHYLNGFVSIKTNYAEESSDLTPDQARTLANHLLTLANKAEHGE